MKGKKEKAERAEKGTKEGGSTEEVRATDELGSINSKAELKSFLLSIRDRMAERSAAAIYASSAMNHVLTLPQVYELLDNENKELARDIFLRIKQAGMQIKSPPLLFEESDGAAAAHHAKS